MLKPRPILCAFSDNLQPVEEKSPQELLKNGDLVEPEDKIFSRVLRDSISRFVGTSVPPSVGLSVRLLVFGLTAPPLMIK